MSAADARAEEAIARVRLARRADERMTRKQTGKGKRAYWEIFCSGCRTRLVVGEDLDLALAVARRNAMARPCCEIWRMP